MPFTLPRPSVATVAADVRGGATLGLILLAQSLAHAALAHVNPINGPYACVLTPVAYAVFGSSNHLIVGTGAILSVMTGTITGDEYPDMSPGSPQWEERTKLGAHLAVGVGVSMVIMAVLHLASLVHFLSRPALSGFTTGSAFIIVVSQLMPMLGIPTTSDHGFFPKCWWIGSQLLSAQPRTAALSAFLLCLVLLLRKSKTLTNISSPGDLSDGESISVRIKGTRYSGRVRRSTGDFSTTAVYPVEVLIDLEGGRQELYHFQQDQWATLKATRSAVWRRVLAGLSQYKELLAVAVGTLVSYLCGDGAFECIGIVPQGLPKVKMPTLSLVIKMAPKAAVVAFTTFILSWAPAKKFALTDGYDISPQREMLALGLANFAGGCSGGFPVQGGLSRTAIAYDAGVKSRLASVVVAAVICCALLFCTTLFYWVPKLALGTIIVHAAMHLTDFDTAMWLYSTQPGWLDRRGLLVWVVAFCATLAFGIIYGVLASSGLSLLLLLVQVTKASVEELGRVTVEIAIGHQREPAGSPGVTPIPVLKRRDSGSPMPARTPGKIRVTYLWRPIRYFKTQARTVPGVCVLQPQGAVFFANADAIAEYIERLCFAPDRPDRPDYYRVTCEEGLDVQEGEDPESPCLKRLEKGQEVRVRAIHTVRAPGALDGAADVVRGQVEQGWVTLRDRHGARKAEIKVKALVLAADAIDFIDEHALQRLMELMRSIQSHGIAFYIASARGNTRLLLQRNLLPEYDFPDDTPWAPVVWEAPQNSPHERRPLLRRRVSGFQQRSLLLEIDDTVEMAKTNIDEEAAAETMAEFSLEPIEPVARYGGPLSPPRNPAGDPASPETCPGTGQTRGTQPQRAPPQRAA
eukprot:TRINITY_DN60970_c0_g1_i1.p1 TRINITY_DN60970_c0_g1~~TRINITY_DN60970_c0_g1_i1.p1  ORF type:complete len:859 (+),score=257.82 TRINITY_DN60970_c0_g1_i1:88-2664(+)